MDTRSVLDTEFFTYQFPLLVGGVPQNPTADVVQFAFMPSPADQNPGNTDWHTGTWLTSTNGQYIAQILVGPALGGVALTVGLYNVWIKVTDALQIPVQTIGLLSIV